MSERVTVLPWHESGRGRLAAALAAALVAAGLAACGDDGPDDRLPATPPPLQSPTPESGTELNPADAEAAEEILAAFDAYMKALIDLSTERASTAGLAERLHEARITHELFDDVFFAIGENHIAGVIAEGAPTWTVDVMEIDWDHAFEHQPETVIPAATLRVCFDDSNWIKLEQDSGEVVDGPGGRYLSTVTARLIEPDDDLTDEEPAWYIAARVDSSDPC